ncbi:uncharacterized protein STEHIDRAFT_165987, partial [Stereum hirsutum FP-91666 SS1]|uniref:uncharacterized protein n=1 Tax=Stereum hirsutum (strain FP-91666) TaxID=721885 RepID=UPI000440D003
MSSAFSTKCPPELLVECFLYCVYADVPDMDPDSAPILLARICRRWREVVLETPLLWSRFRLRKVTNQPNEIGLSSQVHSPALIAFGRHLQRSKSMPLTCSLRDSTQAGGGRYDPFFLRLLEEADRWYDIALGGPYRQSDVYVAAHPTSFPNLQSIQILDWPNDASTSLRSIFTSSPEIKRIALKVPYICDCLKLVPSLSQLTSLKIWKTSNVAIEWRQEEHEPHLFSILSQCTSLESLTIGTFLYSQIEFEPGGFDEQQTQAPLTLPSLRFFSFPISDLDFPSIYLRALTFPNLSELEISPTYRLNFELARHRDDLMNFVQRHGALGTVRKLTLGLPPSAEMECRMEILEHFPNVVEVDLAESEPYLSESEGFDGGE